MRLALTFLLFLAPAALASECDLSARPLWSLACSDPQTRSIALEMAATERAAQGNPFLTQGTRAGVMLRGEDALTRMETCLDTADPLPCIRRAALGRIGDLWAAGLVPDPHTGQSRMALAYCPAHAEPLRLVQLAEVPGLLWISVPYGAILTRDAQSSLPRYRGTVPGGEVILELLDGDGIRLEGIDPVAWRCFTDASGWLR